MPSQLGFLRSFISNFFNLGASKYMEYFSEMNIKVLLIEEAAQVMESRCICLLN